MKLKPFFSISLVNTKKCNLNCSYCYERGKFENKEYSVSNIDYIIDFIKKLKNWYNANFEITLIGGEPTLAKNNKYLFRRIKELIQNNFNISIRIITNGYNYNLILNSFFKEDIEFLKPHLIIQVSYDGKIINDKYRFINLNNKLKPTSDQVLKTIFQLINNGFKTNIKSTILLDDFIYIPKILKEFRFLNQKLKNLPGYRFLIYGLTEEKESIINKSKDEIKNILKNSLPKIIKEELNNIEILGEPLVKWFRDFKYEDITTCSAGLRLFSINPDLDLQFCHHVDYLTKFPNELNYLKITDITKEKLDEIINYNYNLYKNSFCEDCNAIYCIKCPVFNYDLLLKNNKTINDSNIYKQPINDNLCFYFQELSKYIHYFNKITRRF